MLSIPIYNPEISYEDNYTNGPFGSFSNKQIFEQSGEPSYTFLGQKVYLPFGMPAGPLLNSRYIKAAFEKGFDVNVYKTVRSDSYPCHPFPNVLAVHFKGKDLTLDQLQAKLLADINYTDPISITNSFGVPSRKADIWQEDAKKAMSYAGKGQVMILSFMGTVKKDQTQQEFIDDFILAAKLSKETGAKVLEANLSCPNIGNEGLVCYNLDVTKKVVEGVRKVIGNTPFVIKIGYFKEGQGLEKLAEIANEYVDDIAAINTLQAVVVDKEGNQALPGPNRLKSGVCGIGIKWAGLEMVKRLSALKKKNSYKYSITGVGGVVSPNDYKEYKNAGADCVMSATGAMWNPNLAQEIKKDNSKNM